MDSNICDLNTNICNFCGGEYEYRNGRWVCKSCGSYKVETFSSEERTLLAEAFQRIRLAEFDEASSRFSDIIERYPENPDAYWGRLMSDHGIKYEIDSDRRMIPTCYAQTIDDMSKSRDYLSALQFADAENQHYYQTQVEYIKRVREEWIEKASKEKPYDIFICYKEGTGNKRRRTKDSIAAQDLYVHLTKQKYRVFYSHESLRDKAGEKYEPYIFHALSTAKVMIVYGSKPEYIESTWLKSEWTRYLKQIKANEKKENSLIVACDGFSPSALPTQLQNMPILDADTNSFYSDLDEKLKELITLTEVEIRERKKLWHRLAPVLAIGGVFFASILLTLFLHFMGRGGIKMDVTNPDHQITVSANFGVFSGDTQLHVEELPMTDDWRAALQQLRMEEINAHVYDIELWVGEDSLQLNSGEVTVSMPVPAGIPENRLMIYDMMKGTPQKVNFEIDRGKIVFVTEKLSIYMIGEEMDCVHKAEPIAAIAPSCTAQGKTEGSYCSLCGDVLLVPEIIPALGHTDDGSYGCVTPKVCTVCDKQISAAKGHVLSADGKKCETCGKALNTVLASTGLSYRKNGNGMTCTITGIGTCADKVLIIPEVIDGYTVTAIEKEAFYRNTSLTSVTLPDSVQTVGKNAFYQCTKLQRVILGNGVTTVGETAFFACTALTEVVIPESVKAIEELAFAVTGIVNFNVAQGNSAYASLDGSLYTKDMKTLVQYAVGKKAVTYVIPEGVTEIGYAAFYGCEDLAVVLHAGVTKIGDYAFYECDITSITVAADNPKYASLDGNLYSKDMKTLIQYAAGKEDKTFVIPDGVERIEVFAMYFCRYLTKITLGKDVKEIADYAFSDNVELQSVDISVGVTFVGSYAFADCTKLKTINFSGTTAQWKQIRFDESWNDRAGNYTVYCTDGTVAKNGTVTLY